MIKFKGLTPLRMEDVDKAAVICAEAFKDYPVHSIIVDESRRIIAMQEVIKGEIKLAIKNNMAFTLGGDFQEVSLWKDANKKPSILSYIRFLSLISIYRLIKNTTREERKKLSLLQKKVLKMRKDLAIPEKCAELNVIAINPEYQGQGRASKIIRTALSELKEQGLSCLLMTNTEKNRTIYEKLGFEVVHYEYIDELALDFFIMLKR